MSSEQDKNSNSKSKKKPGGVCSLSAEELVLLAATLGYFLADDLTTDELVVLIEFLSAVRENLALILSKRKFLEETGDIIIIE
jgi:hypothetical protein